MIKLSVSTLGCPEWTFEEIVSNVSSFGYDGLELRGIGPELDTAQSPYFSTRAALKSSVALAADHGLAIAAVDTSAQLVRSDAAERADHLSQAKIGIDLAAAVGAGCVRVFAGVPDAAVSRADASKLCADGLLGLAEYAASLGDVKVVLETHDYMSRGAEVAAVFAQFEHPSAGVLWDMHHPYRQGEAPEETYKLLKPWIAFAHVKDSRLGETYCLLGDGDVPIKTMVDLLKYGGYDGWLSLEWEKRWVPDLPGPEIAFPQHVQKLREYLA